MTQTQLRIDVFGQCRGLPQHGTDDGYHQVARRLQRVQTGHVSQEAIPVRFVAEVFDDQARGQEHEVGP